MHSAPLVAFGWISSAMLWWLLAAAAPIVIHLWSRSKYREMPWAAMQYLLAALKKKRRRLLFEQWLLLAVRTLVIALAVLAVAEPYFEQALIRLLPGQRTHRVLVVDNSYSMAYKPTEQSRLDRAKELAVQIVEQSPQGDAFTLVLMAGAKPIVIGRPAFEPREVLREIEGLAISHTSADLTVTLAAVEQVLEQAKNDPSRLARHEVHFLTDLGRVGWWPPSRDAADDGRRRIARIAKSAAVSVLDVGQASADNTAVVGLRALAPIVTVGRPVAFEARLKNFGRTPQSHRLVELWHEGQRVAQRYVDLPPDQEAAVTLTMTFDTPGDHAVEIRAAPDRLELDDRRCLVVRVRDAVRVLCVDGNPASESRRGACDLLRLALSPQNGELGPALVRPEVVPESGLLERDLAAFDCVFLCNVPQFAPNEIRVLSTYLERGGNLIFFLGDRVLADRYNAQLADAKPRLLPARLGPLVAQAQYRLDPLGYRHRIVRAFRDRERSGLLTTPVGKHFRLEPAAAPSVRRVLDLADGDPLVVEEALGHGRVIVVSTSADLSWSDMPRWPSFLPLVQEMVAYCVEQGSSQRNIEVGQTLDGDAPASAAPATLVRPDRSSEPLPVRGSSDDRTWSVPDVAVSGLYSVHSGTPPARRAIYAVNLHTDESDLAQLGYEDLRDQVWPDVSFAYQTTWHSGDRGAAQALGHRSQLHLALLYAVLGLLLLETYLACRAGHHT